MTRPKKKRTAKVHLDVTPAEATDGTRTLFCGPVASIKARASRDRARVTCRECLRALSLADSRAAAEAQHAPGAPFDPELPYESRGARALEPYQVEIARRADAGEDLRIGPRWSSIDRAAEQWVRVIDDGAPMRTSFRVEAPVQQSYQPSGGVSGREDVLAFSRAIEGAFKMPRVFGDVVLGVAMQRRILEWRMCGRPVTAAVAPGRKGKVVRRLGCSVGELADIVSRELRRKVTERQIEIVEAYGRERVYEALVAVREVAPGPRWRIPFDAVVGLGAIGEILGVTAATVKEYLDDAPIRRSVPPRSRVVHWTIEAELRAWMERTRGPWTWDLLGAS